MHNVSRRKLFLLLKKRKLKSRRTRSKYLINIVYKIIESKKLRTFVLNLLNYFAIAINTLRLTKLRLEFSLNKLLLISTTRLLYYYRLKNIIKRKLSIITKIYS